MALRGSELLLLIRGQNQASAALGRVRRDLMGLENMRDLQARKAQQQRKIAAQQLRIASVAQPFGSRNLALQQRQLRIQNEIANVQGRVGNLKVRQAAIDSRANSLRIQEQRMENRILSTQEKQIGLDAKRLRIDQQILKTQAAIAGLAAGTPGVRGSRGITREQALLRKYEADTRVLMRKQAYGRVSAMPITSPQRKDSLEIARRQYVASQRQAVVAARQVGQLAEAEILLNKTLATQQKELEGVTASSAALKREEKMIQQQIAQLVFAWSSLDARQKSLMATNEVYSRQLLELSGRLEGVTAAAMEAAAATELDTAALKAMQIELAQTNAQIAVAPWEKFASGARLVSHAGRVMQMFGLVSTAALGYLAVNAAKFNTEATRAATQTGALGTSFRVVAKNADYFEKQIIKMMTEVPANQQQLTDTFYNIYSSMNSTLPQGIRLAKLFSQVWVAGGMKGDVNEVADALITLGNNWRISAGDMKAWQGVAASTLATVRFGRLTVEQYTQTMNQLAPAFHGAHQSIEQMNAAIAFNTKLMPNQRMAAASIARMVEIFQRFAAKPKTGFEKLAKDIQTTSGNLRPLNQVIGIMIKQNPKLLTSGVYLTNFFKTISGQQGTVQARRAFQNFVLQFKLYQETLRNVRGDQNEFNRSLKAMERSTGVKWAQFVNNLRALALELGSYVIPALVKMFQPLVKAAKWFENLDEGTKKTIATWASFIAVGTLVGGTILTIVGGLASMAASVGIFIIMMRSRGAIKALEQFGEGAAKAGTAARIAGSEVGSITPIFGAAAGSVAALGLAFALFPSQTKGILHALFLTKTGLEAISFAATTLMTLQLVKWLAASRLAIALVGRVALVAAADAAVLQAALAGIAAMPVIVVTIMVVAIWAAEKFDKQISDWTNKQLNKIPGYKFVDKLMGGQNSSEMEAELKRRVKIAETQLNRMSRIYKQADQPFFHAAGTLTGEAKGAIAAGLRYKEMAAAIDTANQKIVANKQIAATISAQWHKMVPEIKRLQDAMNADPTNYKKILAYNKAVEKLKKLLKDQPALYDAIMQAIGAMDKAEKKSAKDRAAIAKQNQENAKQTLNTMLSNVRNMYDTLLQQNQSAAGQLFSGPFINSPFLQTGIQWGHVINAEDLQKDLSQSLSKFNTWNRDLGKLAAKGAPKDMIDQIRQMGPEQQKNVETLIRMTPGQWAKYRRTFLAEQKAIKAATMKQLNAQLKDYEKHGRAIAQAIITGIRSQDVALENTLRKMINEMFPGLAKQAEGKPKPKATPTAQPQRAPIPMQIHNTYNITSVSSEASIKAQIRHANMIKRNRG